MAQLYHSTTYLAQQKQKQAQNEERMQGGVDVVDSAQRKAKAKELALRACVWAQAIITEEKDKDQVDALIKVREVLKIYLTYLR